MVKILEMVDAGKERHLIIPRQVKPINIFKLPLMVVLVKNLNVGLQLLPLRWIKLRIKKYLSIALYTIMQLLLLILNWKFISFN